MGSVLWGCSGNLESEAIRRHGRCCQLRRAMVRPGRERLRGAVEVDEAYWGAPEEGAVGRLRIIREH